MLEEHLKGLNCIFTRNTLLYDFSAGWEELFAALTRLGHIFLKVPVKHLAVILINYPYQVNPTQHREAQPAQLKVPSPISASLTGTKDITDTEHIWEHAWNRPACSILVVNQSLGREVVLKGLRPTASTAVSPGTCSNCKLSAPCPLSTGWETLHLESCSLCFSKPSRSFWCVLQYEIHCAKRIITAHRLHWKGNCKKWAFRLSYAN